MMISVNTWLNKFELVAKGIKHPANIGLSHAAAFLGSRTSFAPRYHAVRTDRIACRFSLLLCCHSCIDKRPVAGEVGLFDKVMCAGRTSKQ